MKILSIDPGLINLSYIYLDPSSYNNQSLNPSSSNDTPNIIKWQTISVTNKNYKKMKFEELTEELLLTLNENFNDEFDADIVLIENQPSLKNMNMKSISVVIYTYFNMMRLLYGNIKEVKFISATNKLKCKKGKNLKIDTYKDRKKSSIELAKLYVTDLFPNWIEFFNNQKKIDDYSDCLNQAIYYMEFVLKIL